MRATATIIPTMRYRDAPGAIAWLCDAFGFEKHLVVPGEDGTIAPFDGDTSIFITPGYRFKAVDILMTNFHLPRSTLFMLVSAFAGLDTMKAAYAHAIATGYRFYSYGDASLLFRNEGTGA